MGPFERFWNHLVAYDGAMVLRSRLSLGKPQAFDEYPVSIPLSSYSRSTSTPRRRIPGTETSTEGTLYLARHEEQAESLHDCL